MNIRTKYVLLLVTFAVADKQVKLEDIERDNLLSERRVNREEETVKIGHTQYLTGAIHVGPSGEASSESAGNDLGEDIVYAQPASAGSNEQYRESEQQTTIQYVTPQQYEKDYEVRPTSASFAHPVHEAAAHTYSAPARQSLIHPIVFKPAASPSPYLSQQPKFVYVQAGPQQVSQSGIIHYGQAQHSPENVIQTQQKNAQDDVNYADVEQNHISESSQQAANAPTRQTPYATRALQYYPLLAQTSSLPNYVMVIRNPNQAQAYAIPSIQYAQQALVTQTENGVAQQHLSGAQPTLAASFLNPTLDGTAVLPAPESTAIPHATLQYAAVPQLQYAPQAQQYAPQALHLQPAVQYVQSPQLHHSQQYYPSPQHFTSPLDIYHSLQKHHPTSLLDSYIPSSVILAAQRQRNAALINRQFFHAVSGNFGTPSFAHPMQFYQQGSHQPGYNTIAYSTAQSYSKRSPKLVTERPLKLNKRN